MDFLLENKLSFSRWPFFFFSFYPWPLQDIIFTIVIDCVRRWRPGRNHRSRPGSRDRTTLLFSGKRKRKSPSYINHRYSSNYSSLSSRLVCLLSKQWLVTFFFLLLRSFDQIGSYCVISEKTILCIPCLVNVDVLKEKHNELHWRGKSSLHFSLHHFAESQHQKQVWSRPEWNMINFSLLLFCHEAVGYYSASIHFILPSLFIYFI